MKFQINGHTYIFEKWLPHLDIAIFYRESDPSWIQFRTAYEMTQIGILIGVYVRT